MWPGFTTSTSLRYNGSMPLDHTTGEDLMTTQEAAKELACSPATVLRLVRAGKLTPATPKSPVLQRPRRMLFRRADVERLKAPPSAS